MTAGDILDYGYTGAAQTVLILEPETWYSVNLYSGEV